MVSIKNSQYLTMAMAAEESYLNQVLDNENYFHYCLLDFVRLKHIIDTRDIFHQVIHIMLALDRPIMMMVFELDHSLRRLEPYCSKAIDEIFLHIGSGWKLHRNRVLQQHHLRHHQKHLGHCNPSVITVVTSDRIEILHLISYQNFVWGYHVIKHLDQLK